MPKKSKIDKYENHFHYDLCCTCFTHPLTWCIACICPCCYACKQRYDIFDGDISDYKCCGGAYGDCSCGGQLCPPVCLCLETWICCWCAIFGNRFLVQNMYQLTNTTFEKFIFWLACICSWIMCLLRLFGLSCWELDRICDLIYCAFSACMQTQQAAELTYQRKQGNHPSAKEMQDF